MSEPNPTGAGTKTQGTAKAYLGDGVYAEHDGFSLILTTSNGLRNTNTIYLEPLVLDCLLHYVRRFQAEKGGR